MSYDHKLITKQYQFSATSVPAWSIISLGTVDLANHNTEYTENLVKIEFSFGTAISVEYLSAELHVLIGAVPYHFIPSAIGSACGDQGDYNIGTEAKNRLFSHLMYPDNSNFTNYFSLFFGPPSPHPQLADYFQMEIFAITPNYTGHCGAIITTYYPNHLPQNHDY